MPSVMRLRRVQLSVPGSSEKMLRKAAASSADHVFCDLEDAVAPSVKESSRATIVAALNGLDWGKKTRCVRINDVATQWCHADVIAVVEGARENIDTIMLPKAKCASDVVFLDHLLTQLELRLQLKKRIGIEVLIEEVEGLQNVESIAGASDRLEALIFGMGDYSGSQGIESTHIGGTGDYPGDIYHYPRFRITMAARTKGLDAVDGPFANFADEAAFRHQAQLARAVGMVGKWAIHPSQIPAALEIFSPTQADVDNARKLDAAYRAGEAKGLGAVQVDGVMIDIAVLRLVQNTLKKADLIGM